MGALIWITRDAAAEQAIGSIPEMLNADDPRSAADQFRQNYISGWNPIRGFRLRGSHLIYGNADEFDGEEDYIPLAFTMLPLTEELVVIYDHALVLVFAPPSVDPLIHTPFEVARID